MKDLIAQFLIAKVGIEITLMIVGLLIGVVYAIVKVVYEKIKK